MGTIVLVLISATFVEKLCGTDIAVRYLYTAPWTIALWAAAVFFGGWYVLRTFRSGGMRWSVFALHLSFVIILLGAMVTHTFGREGALSLRIGESSSAYLTREGTTEPLPFSVRLDDFEVQYYPGTATAEDYLSRITITPTEDQPTTGEIAMNRIFRYRGWRFYQSSYDEDGGGSTLLLSYDPAGIAITYLGYLLLLLSFLAYLLPRSKGCGCGCGKRTAKASALLLLLLLPAYASAADAPKALQRPVAETFGNLYVEYNGRICPMSVLAADVCTKLYGKPYYTAEDGTRYTANQVLTGILFYYNDWHEQPLKHSRKAIQNTEREAVFSMVANGQLFRIWPPQSKDPQYNHPADSLSPLQTGWYDINAAGEAAHLGEEEWQFRMFAMQYVAHELVQGHNIAANELLKKLRIYQQQCVGVDNLPTETHFRSEQAWALFPYTKPLALFCITFCLVLCLVQALYRRLRRSDLPCWWTILTTVVWALVFLFLTAMLAWRWYISGHIPLSNGHETMQSLAWCCLLIGLLYTVLHRHKNAADASVDILRVGIYGMAGIFLLVSMMSASNPQITHLMPVLQSPLLSLHVSVIMLSYALLAFVMLNSLGALFASPEQQRSLMHLSRRMLRPAIACLAIGIFLGAVWANISWGRYWGWDPKEVWALITLLIYAAPLHSRSLGWFARPRFFHVYCLVAFLTVLFTYFGVNFLLGGLHAYA